MLIELFKIKHGGILVKLTWITKRWPEMLFPYSARRASVANKTPCPVAASLPRDPPRSYKFQENSSLY